MDSIDVHDRRSLERTPAHEVAIECLLAGIEAAHPVVRVGRTISVGDGQLSIETDDGGGYDLDRFDEVVVVGGGNAAGGFAAALEDELGDSVTGGAVVTDDSARTNAIDVLPGDHPLPSETGVRSARRVLEVATAAEADDLVIAVVTGGASALLAAPADPLTLADLRAVTGELLACGASIDEINAVRKHCSAIKGGQLARAASPATVVTLVLSDVVGDDYSVIGSGPTVPDPSTYADAVTVLERYDLDIPDAVREYLEAGVDGACPETPTVGDPAFEDTHTHLVGSGRSALEAARDVAIDRGYEPLLLSSRVRGEAREAAKTHVAIAEESLATGNPVFPPAVLLSGGETTVTIRGDGQGGPNQEFALSAALELGSGITLAAIDTDGIDGATEVAGALVDVTTVEDLAPARAALDDNDAFTYLKARGDVIETGPTGTNLNDMRVVVVEE